LGGPVQGVEVKEFDVVWLGFNSLEPCVFISFFVSIFWCFGFFIQSHYNCKWKFWVGDFVALRIVSGNFRESDLLDIFRACFVEFMVPWVVPLFFTFISVAEMGAVRASEPIPIFRVGLNHVGEDSGRFHTVSEEFPTGTSNWKWE